MDLDVEALLRSITEDESDADAKNLNFLIRRFCEQPDRRDAYLGIIRMDPPHGKSVAAGVGYHAQPIVDADVATVLVPRHKLAAVLTACPEAKVVDPPPETPAVPLQATDEPVTTPVAPFQPIKLPEGSPIEGWKPVTTLIVGKVGKLKL